MTSSDGSSTGTAAQYCCACGGGYSTCHIPLSKQVFEEAVLINIQNTSMSSRSYLSDRVIHDLWDSTESISIALSRGAYNLYTDVEAGYWKGEFENNELWFVSEVHLLMKNRYGAGLEIVIGEN
jgi:hypothetical protein